MSLSGAKVITGKKAFVRLLYCISYKAECNYTKILYLKHHKETATCILWEIFSYSIWGGKEAILSIVSNLLLKIEIRKKLKY